MANTMNLALGLDEDELKDIGRKVKEEYQADVDSRTEFDKRRAGWKKLFSGFREPKNYPWPNASNTHVPMMTEACLQFQSRAYEALVGREIARCYCTDINYADKADRAGKFLNYQLRYQMEEWEEDMDVLLLDMPINGSSHKKTYWDYMKFRPASRFLGVDELVLPYRCKRFEDAPRKTHVLWKELNDLKIGQMIGYYTNIDDKWIGVPVMDATPTPEAQIQADKINDTSPPPEQFWTMRPILEQHRMLDLNFDLNAGRFVAKDGIMRPYIVWVDWESETVIRIYPGFHLNTFTGLPERDEYFTNYTFIPNPDSYIGYGFGHLIDHINETADTIINQLIDAGHLANVRGGFYAGISGIKQGDLGFKMGEFKPVNILSDDIRKHIFPMDFKEPSNVLFTLLGLLQDYTKSLTTTADWMSGSLPPSDTAATTMLAIIEQGLKVFSVIQKRSHRALKSELKKIYRLNQQFLNEKEYFTVVDTGEQSKMQYFVSGKDDFANEIEVIPVSDPNITSRAEKLIKSQQVMADVMSAPISTQGEKQIYLAKRDYYEALEVQNIDELLPPPPDEPPPPPDLPPQEENALALKETGTPALPQQDHIDHIQEHEAFLESSWAERLTPQGKNVLDAHIKEHLAFAYLAEQQAQMELAQMEEQYGMGGIPAGGEGTMGQVAPDTGVQELAGQIQTGNFGNI